MRAFLMDESLGNKTLNVVTHLCIYSPEENGSEEDWEHADNAADLLNLLCRKAHKPATCSKQLCSCAP